MVEVLMEEDRSLEEEHDCVKEYWKRLGLSQEDAQFVSKW